MALPGGWHKLNIVRKVELLAEAVFADPVPIEAPAPPPSLAVEEPAPEPVKSEAPRPRRTTKRVAGKKTKKE